MQQLEDAMHESHFLGIKCVGCMLGMVALLAASIIAVHHLVITPMPSFLDFVFTVLGPQVALPMLPMVFDITQNHQTLSLLEKQHTSGRL